jgi:disulfide bond formation protein DsbB
VVTTDAVSLFLALLAVLAEVAVVVAVVLAVGGRVSPSMAEVRATLAGVVGPQALGLALAVGAVATAGSLYFSEVAHFTPCRLCWYQRICMYPLVPLLAWAAWRREMRVRIPAALLAGVGALIASYHVLIERYPTLESGACDPSNPCSLIWVRRFGYQTIPTMALSAFALILVLLAVARPDDGN